MRWKYIDHTADAMIQAFGKNLEEAFSNSAVAMFNLLTDITKVEDKIKCRIKIQTNTLEKLLFDFLDELLFLLDTKLLIFCKFSNIKISSSINPTNKDNDYILTCDAFGDKASNYETHGDIKAPTYNEMSINIKNDFCTITFVVDI